MAEGLVRLGVAVIFTPSDQAAAKRASQSIPIVFNTASDPVASRVRREPRVIIAETPNAGDVPRIL